jgi:hypothetical protein
MILRHLTGFLHKHGRISKGALERSSSTISHKIKPHVSTGYYWYCPVLLSRAYYSFQRLVVTLDPNKFAEKKQRRFHIGNRQKFYLYVALHNQSNPVKVPELFYNVQRKLRIRSSYPSDTSAFLYYFTTLENPRIAGQLRLRVATSDDHASFESGSDVLKLNGQPWSRSLCTVSKYYPPLYEKLREEGLVPDDLDAVLSTFTRAPRGQQIYTLNDTFIVDFSRLQLSLTVVTEEGMETLKFVLFCDTRPTRVLPYTGAYTNHHLPIDDSNKSVGSALVRFERSTLPDHKGTRTVVLRFLKIITSVKCVIPLYDDNIRPPKEGELYRRFGRYTINKLNPPVWSANIDKSVSLRGLQLLWDT